MPLFLLRIPISSKIFSSFENYLLWDDFVINDSAIWTEFRSRNSEYQAQSHSLLSFSPCISFCAPLKSIFLGRAVLMLWSFTVYTNLRLVFQYSQVHHTLAVLLHPFWFLGQHLPPKLLHYKLAKVLLFAIGMQVQQTIYCLKSPFLDQVLSMHHQQDFLCLSHPSIGSHQSALGYFVLDWPQKL